MLGRQAAVATLVVAACCKDAFARDVFTTNAICKKNNCINPVFPGMEDLHRLEAATWTCSSLRDTASHMSFCRAAVSYDPALPDPTATDGGKDTVEDMVKRQDHAASTMFFYHMAGLGLEGWDYTQPWNTDNDCVKSIWRMVCYTYFPRAKLGCQPGLATQYTKPCQSSCHNYIRQCGVECCDESVQCVFEHTKAISPTQSLTTSGYVPHDGPSSMCTGAGRRSQAPGGLFAAMIFLQMARWFGGDSGSSSSSAAGSTTTRRTADSKDTRSAGMRRRFLWLAAPLAVVTVSLQGCDADVPTHSVGNWRAEKDYLLEFEFVPPGASAEYATLNSCGIDRLSPTLQCNGRGVCRMWDESNLNAKSAAFCECSRDWADPECRTRRKSQVLAYLLAVVLGPFGADHFYLGFWYQGMAKLLTLGGFGFWWAYDIIRVGSAPVETINFRLAGDLPHWVFVLLTVNFALLIGFVISWVTATQHLLRRRKDVLLMQAEEEARALGLKRGQHPELKRHAGADPGEYVPEVKLPQQMQANAGQASFYGSMNQMGQVPVSPVSSIMSGDYKQRPARPGPWATSFGMPVMPGPPMMPPSPPLSARNFTQGVRNPTPPGTMPPAGGPFGTVYQTPTTPAFPTQAFPTQVMGGGDESL